MNIEKGIQEWKTYENSMYDLFRSSGHKCERNVILKGVRGSHQIDVLLRLDTPLKNHLWLIECKKKIRPIGKNDLQSFKTVIDDIGADHGYLISESGFQKGAVEMAKTLNITLASYSSLSVSFVKEQLDSYHQQSKSLYAVVEQDEDDGNMDPITTVELKSNDNTIVEDQIIEIHISHEGDLFWILPLETCKKFITDFNTLKIMIPWEIPNLNLETVPPRNYITGRTKSGKSVTGSYNIVFRTFTGPVNIIAHVSCFK